MEIAYQAQTETCTLLLDANGICRSVLAASSSQGNRPARIPESAERCIGAQYVATLDFRQEGALVHMPKAGQPMLFAKIEIDGRITLVRSAPVIRFEAVAQFDSGVRENPVCYGDDDERTTPFEIDDVTIPTGRRITYPPPRQSMKVPIAAPPARPLRPSVVRVSAPLYEGSPTLPFRRVAR